MKLTGIALDCFGEKRNYFTLIYCSEANGIMKMDYCFSILETVGFFFPKILFNLSQSS